jgi:hypothetical protein
MRPVRISVAVVSVAVLAGSLGGAPVPKEIREAKFYFPTSVGTKWVTKAGTSVCTRYVHQVKEESGKHIIYTDIEESGCGNSCGCYHVSRAGVWHLWGYSDMIENPVPIQRLKLPFRKGEMWTSVARENDVEAFRFEFTSVAEEPVTVAAGKYETIRVDWAKVVKGETVQAGSEWYAPNVGVVKATFRQPQNPWGGWGRGQDWREADRTTELRAVFPPGTATRETHKKAVEDAGGTWHDLIYRYK